MELSFWILLLIWCAAMGAGFGARRGAVLAHLGLALWVFCRLLLWVHGNPGEFCLNGVVLLIQPVLCLFTAALVGLIAHRVRQSTPPSHPFYAAFASCLANALVVAAVPFLAV